MRLNQVNRVVDLMSVMIKMVLKEPALEAAGSFFCTGVYSALWVAALGAVVP